MEDPFQLREPPTYAETEGEVKPLENKAKKKTLEEQQAELHLQEKKSRS